MLERTQARTLPLLNRAADIAPAVNACCGACRTCVTANAASVVTAAIAGLVLYARRSARRFARPS
jgi:hypothetical protein